MARRATATRQPGESTGAASRQAMIDAAVTLFARHGYDATGVQDIVEHAGLTKGSFYYAFSGKDDLLRLIQDVFIERCLRAVDEVLEAREPADVALTAAIDWLLAIVSERRDELTIFFQESRYLALPLFSDVRRKRDLFEQKFELLLTQGQEVGMFREVPGQITAFGIIGMCAWAYHWMRPDSGPTQDISRVYADVLLNGLYDPRRRVPRTRTRPGKPRKQS